MSSHFILCTHTLSRYVVLNLFILCTHTLGRLHFHSSSGSLLLSTSLSLHQCHCAQPTCAFTESMVAATFVNAMHSFQQANIVPAFKEVHYSDCASDVKINKQLHFEYQSGNPTLARLKILMHKALKFKSLSKVKLLHNILCPIDSCNLKSLSQLE